MICFIMLDWIPGLISYNAFFFNVLCVRCLLALVLPLCSLFFLPGRYIVTVGVIVVFLGNSGFEKGRYIDFVKFIIGQFHMSGVKIQIL